MLTHPTIDQLRALRLDGMAEAFVELQSQDAARDLAPAEWLALLLDREAAYRGTQRFKSRLRNAKLRHGQASIEDVDYRAARRLDKALFQQLVAGRWIAEHRNLLITGPCGVGKSWLSCALAQRACRDGYTVHYARVPRLFADLELAHGDGRFARLFRTLTKADLLILDDWGPDRLSANQRRDLMLKQSIRPALGLELSGRRVSRYSCLYRFTVDHLGLLASRAAVKTILDVRDIGLNLLGAHAFISVGELNLVLARNQ